MIDLGPYPFGTETLADARVLITGGTGSLGHALSRRLLDETTATVIVYSRDELKQGRMRGRFDGDERLEFRLGDVRDAMRLRRACRDVDIVIHAAAIKQIPRAERDPIEAVKTNILGARNIVEACLDSPRATRVVALSSDKASSPVNLYGATKLVSDKIFVAANREAGIGETKFANVRYGSVLASRGSVVDVFRRQRESGVLTLTDPEMTRFCISLEAAAGFVLASLSWMEGGEIFVPEAPSYRLADLARAIAPEAEQTSMAIRAGEKLHEELVSADEARNAYLIDDRVVIRPFWRADEPPPPGATALPLGEAYRSDREANLLSVEQLAAFLGEPQRPVTD